MPVDIAFVQTLCQCVHQQGGGYTDVEALCESVHRYLYVHVGMFKGIVGEACLLGAEYDSDRLVERQGVGSVVVLMRTCGDYFVAFAVEVVECFRSVEFRHIIFMKVEPFRAPDDDIRIYVVDPFVFYYMDVLHAGEVTAAQHSACIMRLIYVFEHYCEVTSAVIQHLFEALFPFFRDEIREKLV